MTILYKNKNLFNIPFFDGGNSSYQTNLLSAIDMIDSDVKKYNKEHHINLPDNTLLKTYKRNFDRIASNRSYDTSDDPVKFDNNDEEDFFMGTLLAMNEHNEALKKHKRNDAITNDEHQHRPSHQKDRQVDEMIQRSRAKNDITADGGHENDRLYQENPTSNDGHKHDRFFSEYMAKPEISKLPKKEGESHTDYAIRTQIDWSKIENPRKQIAIRRVLRNEGGHSDDKSDKGGKTNYGVSQRFLDLIHNNDDWKQFHDLPKDARNITPADSVRVQKDYFMKQMKLDEIDKIIGDSKEADNLHAQILDSGFHQGELEGRIMLQKALDKVLPFESDLKVGTDEDSTPHYTGYIGNKTKLKLDKVIKSGKLKDFNNSIAEMRIKEYNRIVKNDPTQSIYLNGWIDRANKFKL